MKILTLLSLLFMFTNCAPTVQVMAPEKPVEINLNVKIDHNIKVKVDKELEDVMKENKEIF
jgi:hypothetical protein